MDQTQYIVLFAGIYPVKFHTNYCGKMFSPVGKEEEATPFDSIQAATNRAADHSLKAHQFTVKPLTK